MRVSMPQGEEGTPISLVGMVYAPEIGRVANQFSSITYTASKLSLREFEAARMITAHINGCQLCQNWRSATDLPLYLKGLGHDASHSVADHGAVPDDGFYAAVADWRIADIFSPRERIALEMAERMGRSPRRSLATRISGCARTPSSPMPRSSTLLIASPAGWALAG